MYIGSLLAAVLLHCWTVFWIYNTEGMLWAFIGFLAPGFSEMIMIGVSISMAGWFNEYFMLWLGIGITYTLGQLILGYRKAQVDDAS